MYAKVTSGQVQPGKRDEFLATYRKVVELMTEGLPGLKNVYVLTNPESNDVSSIAIYESETDADELENRGGLHSGGRHDDFDPGDRVYNTGGL